MSSFGCKYNEVNDDHDSKRDWHDEDENMDQIETSNIEVAEMEDVEMKDMDTEDADIKDDEMNDLDAENSDSEHENTGNDETIHSDDEDLDDEDEDSDPEDSDEEDDDGDYNLYFHRASMTRQDKQNNCPCDCDHCDPTTYVTGCHPKLDLTEQEWNKYGREATAVPDLLGMKYDAMDLARHCVAYASKSELDMNNKQINAIARFKGLYRKWKGHLSRPSGLGLPDEVLCDLVQCFNGIFFLSSLPSDLPVFWSNFTQPHALGQTTAAFEGSPITIEIHPSNCEPEKKYGRRADRLNVLLHETIHAYFDHMRCESGDCPTFHGSIGDTLHGPAFTLLEGTLSRLFSTLLDTESIENHYRSLHNYYRHVATYDSYPSICAWRTFGFWAEKGTWKSDDDDEYIHNHNGKYYHYYGLEQGPALLPEKIMEEE